MLNPNLLCFIGSWINLSLTQQKWWWPKVTPFLAYFAKLGCSWVTTQVTLKKSILNIWKNEIPPSNSPSWNLVWHKHKVQKEVAFLWMVFHKVVVVNEWRGRISATMDKSCLHCGSYQVESVKQRFFNCPLAQHVWCYAMNIIW